MNKRLAGIVAVLSIIASPLLFSHPAVAAGAFFYFDPAVGTSAVNSAFSITIKINSGAQAINAAEGAISFDAAKLQVVSLSKTNSIFNFWTTEPAYSNIAGNIVFGGGVPRPGFNGTGGNVITVNFRTKAVGSAQLLFTSGAILANDGKGTNVLSSMSSGNFTISPESTTPGAGNNPLGATSTNASFSPSETIITSVTHPDQNAWYKDKNVKFTWSLPEGFEALSFVFDQKPNTEPSDKITEAIKEKEYDNTVDGIWYFHLRVKDAKEWKSVQHYRVQIDTTPPQPFEVSAEQKDPFDWPTLYFETVDKQSGISRYETNIGSLEGQADVIDPSKPTLKVSRVEVGEHTAMIKAVDKAGNETFATIKFSVNPIETPEIKNYPAEIKSNDQFFISGTALGNVDINIYIQNSEGKIVTKNTRSDQNGNWYFIGNLGLENGRYAAWVEAVNANGLSSKPTSQIGFLISSPIFARLGSFVVNYFTVFVSLLFMILLIIAAAIYLAAIFRKKLKKETVEVEHVLHDHLESLKLEIDKDLTQLAKLAGKEGFTKEKMRTRVALRDKIANTEKKILKEIRDVEEILH